MQFVTDIIRKVTDDPIISLLENALIAWRTKQTKLKGNVSLNAFAEEIGASRPLVIMWMNGERPVTLNYRKKIAKAIADLVGPSAYEILDVTPPNSFTKSAVVFSLGADDPHASDANARTMIAKIIFFMSHPMRFIEMIRDPNVDAVMHALQMIEHRGH